MTMQYMQAAFYLMGWFQRASADGKITSSEIGEIITEIVQVFGLEIEIDFDN